MQLPEVIAFLDGGYRYLRGVFQYSGGVAANPGFEIQRVRFLRPLPIATAVSAIEAHLQAAGRPMRAFYACELRSPAPLGESKFAEFNRGYVSTLKRCGIYRQGKSPVARSNVCPEIDPSLAPSFQAFSYTVPAADGSRQTFVVSGSGETPEGRGNYADHIIRRGDCSAEGLRERARWVLGEMERRMSALGFDWDSATGTHLYTIYDIHRFLAEELVRRGAAPAGLTWHHAGAPIVDLDYEMDVRGLIRETVVQGIGGDAACAVQALLLRSRGSALYVQHPKYYTLHLWQ